MPRSIVNNTRNNIAIEYCAYNKPGNGNFKSVSDRSRQSTFSDGSNYLAVKVKKGVKFGTAFLNGLTVSEMHFLPDHPRFKGHDVYVYVLNYDSKKNNIDLPGDDVELIPPEDSHLD